MTFNPELMGFTPLARSKRACTDDHGCILSFSGSGIQRDGSARLALRLMLDRETEATVRTLFGDRCSVATDGDMRIVLYAGSQRKLNVNGAGGRAAISMTAVTEQAVKRLGTFRHYSYRAEKIANGEAVLLTPTEKID